LSKQLSAFRFPLSAFRSALPLAQMRAEAPVCQMRGRFGPVWVVTRYDDMLAIMKDERLPSG
jgi:cytochrome P450